MRTLLSSPCQLRLGVGLSHLGYILILELNSFTSTCYESPKKGIVSQAFEHLIKNLKTYNGVEI